MILLLLLLLPPSLPLSLSLLCSVSGCLLFQMFLSLGWLLCIQRSSEEGALSLKVCGGGCAIESKFFFQPAIAQNQRRGALSRFIRILQICMPSFSCLSFTCAQLFPLVCKTRPTLRLTHAHACTLFDFPHFPYFFSCHSSVGGGCIIIYQFIHSLIYAGTLFFEEGTAVICCCWWWWRQRRCCDHNHITIAATMNSNNNQRSSLSLPPLPLV